MADRRFTSSGSRYFSFFLGTAASTGAFVSPMILVKEERVYRNMETVWFRWNVYSSKIDENQELQGKLQEVRRWIFLLLFLFLFLNFSRWRANDECSKWKIQDRFRDPKATINAKIECPANDSQAMK